MKKLSETQKMWLLAALATGVLVLLCTTVFQVSVEVTQGPVIASVEIPKAK